MSDEWWAIVLLVLWACYANGGWANERAAREASNELWQRERRRRQRLRRMAQRVARPGLSGGGRPLPPGMLEQITGRVVRRGE